MGEWLIQDAGGEMVPLQDSIVENLRIKRFLSMEIYQWQTTPANHITEIQLKPSLFNNEAIQAYHAQSPGPQKKRKY